MFFGAVLLYDKGNPEVIRTALFFTGNVGLPRADVHKIIHGAPAVVRGAL
jgi:hypothetical protein